jgi:MoaA/NifB/PqqE/SkfB family radical SAM enzyme
MHLDCYDKYTPVQIDALKEHFLSRFEYRTNKKIFGVVYDIIHQCDLNCRGCGTNATFTPEKSIDVTMPSLNEIRNAFKKIKAYADSNNLPVFINIGGGEPFLRRDIHDILKEASDFFGVSGVGVDTNGTLDNSYELITSVLDYVSYVGISINGLEDYHNWWAGNNKINAFNHSINVVERLCSDSQNAKKIEVTSVATKKNIDELPDLMDILVGIGVRNYSIHRAMSVGRMAYNLDIVPDADDYLHLLVSMVEKSRINGLKVHLHHSIESIHATLLLGLNTYAPDKIGDPDAGSSLGIEPEGQLVFDPWCTTGIWKRLSGGNIYEDTTDFTRILENESGTVFDLAKMYTAPHLRCQGCSQNCSGGSRIAAAATRLSVLDESMISDSDILSAMTAIDPACPLFATDHKSL